MSLPACPALAVCSQRLKRWGTRVAALALASGGVVAAEIETARLSFLPDAVHQFAGESALKEFLFRLPEHVLFHPGCELTLNLRPSWPLLAEVCAVRVAVNDQELTNAAVRAVDVPEGAALPLRVPMPEEILLADWNRLSLRIVLQKRGTNNAARTGVWELHRTDNYLALAFERFPLFPELGRFPHTLVEEKLLRAAGVGTAGAVVTILLPAERRDVHFRACAVLGARLGQLGYVTEKDCRLALIDDWQRAGSGPSFVVFATRDQLARLLLPTNLFSRITALRAGEGLLGEFTRREAGTHQRWLIVCGADDIGLEKAVLTLGDATTMAALPPNPVVITDAPRPPAGLDAIAPGEAKDLPALGNEPLQLRGIYRAEKNVSTWRMSPGYELSSGGTLQLAFAHSKALLAPNSVFEVLLNETRLDTIQLTAENAESGVRSIAIPRGVRGADPMLLTFRAHLDIGEANCDSRRDELAWVTVLPQSTIQAPVVPISVRALDQIHPFLLRDRFLRKTAFLLPATASLEELALLLELDLYLGGLVPGSPLVWPEACGFTTARPPVERLENRSVLLLAPVTQWATPLPANVRLPIESDPADAGRVRIQGRSHLISDFEPSIAVAQLTTSPWTGSEALVMMGGWKGFAQPAVRRLLMDPNSIGRLYGDLVAMDEHGRAAPYDLSTVTMNSFAEKLQRRIPVGQSLAETHRRVTEDEARAARARRENWMLFWGLTAAMGVLVLLRVMLMWSRERLRRRVTARDLVVEPRV